MRFYNYIKRSEKGFTLVELLIVVIILAVLSGIAVPSYMALRNRARESAAENEMRNITTAIEMYIADNETTPSDLGDLSDYMQNVPNTDPWGGAYVLAGPGGGGYTLTSGGVDGDTTSTDDNIVFTDGQMTSDGAYPNTPEAPAEEEG